MEDISGLDWDPELLRPFPLAGGLDVISRGQVRFGLPVLPSAASSPSVLAFSSKYGLLVVASGDCLVVYPYAAAEEALMQVENVLLDRAMPADKREAIQNLSHEYARLELGAPCVLLALSPDESVLVAASASKVQAFELSGLQQNDRRSSFWHSPATATVAAQHLAVRECRLALVADGLVSVFDMERNSMLRELDVRGAMCAAWAGDGTLIAVGTAAGTVECFRVDDGSKAWSKPADGKLGPVLELNWARHEVVLACHGPQQGDGGRIAVHDLALGRSFGASDPLLLPARPPGWPLRFVAAYVAPWSVFVVACTHGQAVTMLGAWEDGGDSGWSRWNVKRGQDLTLAPQVLDQTLWGLGERPRLANDKDADERVFPLGMCVAMCATAKVNPFFVLGGSKELEGKPWYAAPPTLLLPTTDGLIEAVGLVDPDVDAPSRCTPSAPLPSKTRFAATAKQAESPAAAVAASSMTVAKVPVVQWATPVKATPAPATPAVAAPSATAAKDVFGFSGFSFPSAQSPLLLRPPTQVLPATPLLQSTPPLSAAPASPQVEAMQARMAALELENQQLKQRERLRHVPDLVTSLAMSPSSSRPPSSSPALPRMTPAQAPGSGATELQRTAYLLVQEFEQAVGHDLDYEQEEEVAQAAAQVRGNAETLERHLVSEVRQDLAVLSADVDAFQRGYFMTEWQIEEADALSRAGLDPAVSAEDAARLGALESKLQRVQEAVAGVQEAVAFRRRLVVDRPDDAVAARVDMLRAAAAAHQAVRERFKTVAKLQAIVDAMDKGLAAHERRQQQAQQQESADAQDGGNEAQLALLGRAAPAPATALQLEACLRAAAKQASAGMSPLGESSAFRKTMAERIDESLARLAADKAEDLARSNAAKRQIADRLSSLRVQAARNLEAARTPSRIAAVADKAVPSPSPAAAPLNFASPVPFVKPAALLPPAFAAPAAAPSLASVAVPALPAAPAAVALSASTPGATRSVKAALVAYLASAGAAEYAAEDKIDALLAKYEGKLPLLASKLENKYKLKFEYEDAPPASPMPPALGQLKPLAGMTLSSPAAAQLPPDHRGRLALFYQKYNPDKMGDVDKLLTKYAGREAEMWGALRQKYPVAGDFFAAMAAGDGGPSAPAPGFGDGGGFSSLGAGFGSSPSGGGAAMGGGFASPAPSFGLGGFGSALPASTAGGFGSALPGGTAGGFGSTPGGFGSTPGGFGSTPGGFGPTPGGFGPTTGFGGQQPSLGGFGGGGMQQSSGFGGGAPAPLSSGFGAAAQSSTGGFGALAQSSLGAAGGFGGAAAANPSVAFGNSPSAFGQAGFGTQTGFGGAPGGGGFGSAAPMQGGGAAAGGFGAGAFGASSNPVQGFGSANSDAFRKMRG